LTFILEKARVLGPRLGAACAAGLATALILARRGVGSSSAQKSDAVELQSFHGLPLAPRA